MEEKMEFYQNLKEDANISIQLLDKITGRISEDYQWNLEEQGKHAMIPTENTEELVRKWEEVEKKMRESLNDYIENHQEELKEHPELVSIIGTETTGSNKDGLARLLRTRDQINTLTQEIEEGTPYEKLLYQPREEAFKEDELFDQKGKLLGENEKKEARMTQNFLRLNARMQWKLQMNVYLNEMKQLEKQLKNPSLTPEERNALRGQLEKVMKEFVKAQQYYAELLQEMLLDVGEMIGVEEPHGRHEKREKLYEENSASTESTPTENKEPEATRIISTEPRVSSEASRNVSTEPRVSSEASRNVSTEPRGSSEASRTTSTEPKISEATEPKALDVAETSLTPREKPSFIERIKLWMEKRREEKRTLQDIRKKILREDEIYLRESVASFNFTERESGVITRENTYMHIDCDGNQVNHYDTSLDSIPHSYKDIVRGIKSLEDCYRDIPSEEERVKKINEKIVETMDQLGPEKLGKEDKTELKYQLNQWVLKQPDKDKIEKGERQRVMCAILELNETINAEKYFKIPSSSMSDVRKDTSGGKEQADISQKPSLIQEMRQSLETEGRGVSRRERREGKHIPKNIEANGKDDR